MLALELELGPTCEMVITGDLGDKSTQEVLANVQRRFLPHKVIAFAGKGAAKPQALAGLLEGKSILGNEPTLYICEGFTCQAPVQGHMEIARALDQLTPSGLFE
jgi:uncharacterized protein YyaL (SSP411 family)